MHRTSLLWVLAVCITLAAAACASAPVVVAPPVPAVTWEQKIAWIVRLEDQRILREPNPPPRAVIQGATTRTPAVYAAPAPSDLIVLLGDEEARTRRRAALAVGRVGLVEGVEPLTGLLDDVEPEVRQMAAFALGLIGHASARPALLPALDDPEPLVQGRAAEALGLIGDRADAEAVAGMVRRHVATGVLAGIEPDDLTYPQAPPVEAARLGLYALVRLGAYEPIAGAVIGEGGQPVSRWWPVAYALQRVGDPRAVPALRTLLATPGRFTAAFAARGLGTSKVPDAAAVLRPIVVERQRHPAVVIQAIRALAALGDRESRPALIPILADRKAEPNLRLEAATAFAALADADAVDVLIELLADPAPAIRAAALRALARVQPESLMATLAGLEPDPHWSVRAAEAAALAAIPFEQSALRLGMLLEDEDLRVVPAAIAALAAARPAGVEGRLIEFLRADDFATRAAAATALGELKAKAAVPALLDAHKIATGDSAYGARTAILAALNQIEPATARQLLEQALGDRDWAVRVRAATLLRDHGVTSVADTIRPAHLGQDVTDPAWQLIVSPQFSPRAFIELDHGTIELELAVLDAPLTVANFIALARRNFFSGIAIHRVVPDFVVQDGDPRGDGEGGPGYTIRDEINQRPYLRGTLGMALDWSDTGGSQFFITHSPQPHLDARYTVFGHVVDGMDVVDRIQVGDVIRDIRIWDGVNPQE